jgi:maltose O-acetyltransferase
MKLMTRTIQSAAKKLHEVFQIFLASRLCPNSMRCKLLRSFGWNIGEDSVIRWGIDFTAVKVMIGKNSFVGRHALFDGGGTITIEDSVRIGPHVRIFSTTHPIEQSVKRRIFGIDHDLDTRICYGCWLGASVMVLPGVTIAPGCVIAAGAVVSKDTQPNGLYGGVPAKRIKDLPTDYSSSL